MNPADADDERSLFTAMREQIESTPMSAGGGRRFTARPRVALGGVAVTMGSAVALAAGLGAFAGTAPAFAVTDNADGSVTITLDDLSAIGALNAKLSAEGVAVRAVPVQAGCTATAQVVSDRYAEPAQPPDGEPPAVLYATENPSAGLISVTVYPPSKPGLTLVVAASRDVTMLAGEVVQGAVPACVSWPLQSAPGS